MSSHDALETITKTETKEILKTLYLQFLHPLVVVCNRGLKGLQELLLRLQLFAHGARPQIPRFCIFCLTDKLDCRALGTRGLDPKHPTLGVSINFLLKLHFVHLEKKKLTWKHFKI